MVVARKDQTVIKIPVIERIHKKIIIKVAKFGLYWVEIERRMGEVGKRESRLLENYERFN